MGITCHIISIIINELFILQEFSQKTHLDTIPLYNRSSFHTEITGKIISQNPFRIFPQKYVCSLFQLFLKNCAKDLEVI